MIRRWVAPFATVCVRSDKNPGTDGCLIGSVPQRTRLGLAV